VYWWGFLCVLQALANLLGVIEAWFASCSCHPTAFCEKYGLEQAKQHCPMRGKRAPNLSVGELRDHIEGTSSFAFATLMGNLSDLSEEQRGVVLTNWFIGKNFIAVEVALRSACHERIPLKLLCLGHHDITTMRIHLAICLLQFDSLPVGAEMHESVFELLSPLGVLRQAIEDIVSGARSVSEFPRIMYYRTRARFTVTMEISVERLHAELHKSLRNATNHKGNFASVMARKPEILEIVYKSDASVRELASELSSVASACASIKALQLDMHPRIVQFHIEGSLTSDFPHKIAVEVIYHCDLLTQFMGTPQMDIPAPRPPAPLPLEPPVACGGRSDAPGRAEPEDDLDQMFYLFGPDDADATLGDAMLGDATLGNATPPLPGSATPPAPCADAAEEERPAAPPELGREGAVWDDDQPLLDMFAVSSPAVEVASVIVLDSEWTTQDALATFRGAYSFDHFRKAVKAWEILSLPISSFDSTLQLKSFSEVMRPKLTMSPKLLDLFSRSGLDISAITAHAAVFYDIPTIVDETDVGVLMETADDVSEPATGVLPRTLNGNVFFRVVETDPSKILQAADTQAKIGNDDLIIEVVTVCFVDMESKFVVIAEPEHPQHYIFDRLEFDSCCQSIRMWNCDPKERYAVPDYIGSNKIGIYRSLNAMLSVVKPTVPGGDEDMCATFDVSADALARVTDLEELEQMGVTRCVSRTSAVSSWRFAPDVMKQIRLAHEVGKPIPFGLPRLDIPLAKMTCVDMLGLLDHQGWELRIWDAAARTLHGDAPPPYQVSIGRPKYWWCRERVATLMPAYLRCLLNAKDSGFSEIEHFQSASYYIKRAGRSRLTILDDGLGAIALADDEGLHGRKGRRIVFVPF
jgi:hypothetical protein